MAATGADKLYWAGGRQDAGCPELACLYTPIIANTEQYDVTTGVHRPLGACKKTPCTISGSLPTHSSGLVADAWKSVNSAPTARIAGGLAAGTNSALYLVAGVTTHPLDPANSRTSNAEIYHVNTGAPCACPATTLTNPPCCCPCPCTCLPCPCSCLPCQSSHSAWNLILPVNKSVCCCVHLPNAAKNMWDVHGVPCLQMCGFQSTVLQLQGRHTLCRLQAIISTF